MKKLVALLLLPVFLLGLTAAAFAQAGGIEVIVGSEIKVIVDGERLIFREAPFIRSDRLTAL